MPRLRYNLVETALSADIDADDVSISLAAALQEGGVDIPTVASPNTLTIRIGSEIMLVTAYTSGATSATVSRGQEDTAPAEHFAGDPVKHVITKEDFIGGGDYTILVAASDSSSEDQAKADYVCTGTNDEVVFQTIIDTFGTGERLEVKVANGTYSIDAQIDIDCAATFIIVGCPHWRYLSGGDLPVFDKQTSGDYSIFSLSTDGSPRSFNGISISNENQAESVTSPVVELNSGTQLILDHCYVYGFGSTGAPAIGMTAAGARLEAHYCDIESDDAVPAILVATGTSGVRVVLDHTYLWGSNAVEALNTGGACTFTFVDCTIEGNVNGLRIDGDPVETYMPEVRIESCDLSGGGGEAAYLTDIHRLDVRGTTWAGASSGSLFRLSNVNMGVISNLRTGTSAVDRHGIWLLDCNNVLIEGCNLLDYGNETDDTYSGILLDGDTNNCQVIGNRLRTSTAGNKALYGIRVDDSTCDDNLIQDNDLLGSAKTNGNEFSDSGTGTRGWLERELAFVSGALTVAGGVKRNRFARPSILGLTLLNINTAPTGAAVLVDVHKNGTTIYTTQASRPTIAISGNAGQSVALPDVKYAAAGDYLTADVDQIGSTIAGSNLVVLQRYMPI